MISKKKSCRDRNYLELNNALEPFGQSALVGESNRLKFFLGTILSFHTFIGKINDNIVPFMLPVRFFSKQKHDHMNPALTGDGLYIKPS